MSTTCPHVPGHGLVRETHCFECFNEISVTRGECPALLRSALDAANARAEAAEAKLARIRHWFHSTHGSSNAVWLDGYGAAMRDVGALLDAPPESVAPGGRE